MKYILIFFIIAISLLTLPQHSFCQYIEGIYSLIFSLNGEKQLNTPAGLQTFYPDDLIKWEGGNHYSAYWRGSDYFVDAEDIDGVELLNDGSIIFSLAATWNEYRDEDLIKWTPGIGFSMYWDASLAGVPGGNDLDAVHIDNNGDIIFSLSGDWNDYGFKDQDLIKWSPLAGFSLYWQPPELPDSKDVDAVDILLSNDISFSLTSSWSYGGITYQTNDIIKYCFATNSYSLAWDASAFGLGTGSGWNMDAFTTVPIPEPGTLLLLSSGILGLGFMGWCRKRRSSGEK